MLFIVFDIEIVFLYPWAQSAVALGVLGLVEIILFIITVAVVYTLCVAPRAPRLELSRRRPGPPRPGCAPPPGYPNTAAFERSRTHGPGREAAQRGSADQRGEAGQLDRKASLFPATFGLACCAIEMMMTTGAPVRPGRFGMECSGPRPGRPT